MNDRAWVQGAIRLMLISCLVTALLAAFSLSYRYRAESRNRAVGVTLELDTILNYAASSNLSLEEALIKLKGAGLTGVVMAEETVGDLISDGRASIVPQAILLTNEDAALRARIAQGLERRFNMFVPNGGSTIAIGGLNGALARTVSLGIDDTLAAEVINQGIFVIGRMSNPSGVNSDYVKKTIAQAAQAGVAVFLPQGDQVLGRRDAIPTLITALTGHKMLYATPEFARIGGDANVVAQAPELVVRLHAAQAAEIDKLTLGGVLERYGKAAAERNQRVLLLRPLSFTSDPPLDGLTDLVSKVDRQLRKEGLVPGVPHAFDDPGVPGWLLALLAISMLPALFLFHLVNLPLAHVQGRISFVVLGLAVLSGVIEPGRNYAALVAAILYPVLAFTLLIHSPTRHPLIGYLRTSAISLVGGLVVAGLLNGLPFLVKADSFSGVKLAHFVPIAIVGGWLWARDGRWRATLSDPIRWGQAALGVGLLVAFAFMAARTGNDSPAGVSGLEMKLRSVMDQWLYVRPRTKEFLIGHPALVILLMWLASRASEAKMSGWLPILGMIAVIGQTSIVNTLCHLHTPLTVGFARILVGLILGGIIGVLGWGIVTRLAPKRS